MILTVLFWLAVAVLVVVALIALSACSLGLILAFTVKDFSWLDADEDTFNAYINTKLNSKD